MRWANQGIGEGHRQVVYPSPAPTDQVIDGPPLRILKPGEVSIISGSDTNYSKMKLQKLLVCITS